MFPKKIKINNNNYLIINILIMTQRYGIMQPHKNESKNVIHISDEGIVNQYNYSTLFYRERKIHSNFIYTE